MSILSQFKQSQNTDFPNVRPSLDLRFALAKKLDPRITFTRGSTGTYFGPDGLMRTAGVNEPRFDHDPITGQSLGLLIEESRQNLLTSSNDFSASGSNSSLLWNGSISANIITSPDGTTNASKFISNTSPTTSHYPQKAVSSVVENTYTLSVFVKAAEVTTIVLVCGSGSWYRAATFNLITGVATSNSQDVGVTAATTYSITPYPNGWYRCAVTSSTSDGANCFTQIRASTGTKTNGIFGDGVSGFYLYGEQIEAGAFPTSYIPTTASTVTRSADTSNIANISSFFNSNEGTLFVDSEIPYQTNLRFPAIGFTRGAGSGNTIQFYYYNTSTPYVTYLVRDTANKGGDLIGWDSPTQTLGSYKKFIATYKVGEFNYYFNGKLVIRKTDTNKALPTNLTSLDFGYNAPGSPDRLNGHIRRVTYYPIQLTNQQLINLTS